MSKAEPIFRLQLLDLDIDQIRRQMTDIQAALSSNAAVNHAHAELEIARQVHRKAASEVRLLELEVVSLYEKIREYESRLYTGNIRNPKEMIDLQREVEILSRQRGELDEKVLTAMMVLEEAADVERRCEAAHNEAMRHWQEASVSLRQTLEQMQDRVSADMERREAISIAIPRADLNTYTALRAKKPGGTAVGQVKDGACGQCGEEASSILLQQARTGSALALCNGCGRILFVS